MAGCTSGDTTGYTRGGAALPLLASFAVLSLMVGTALGQQAQFTALDTGTHVEAISGDGTTVVGELRDRRVKKYQIVDSFRWTQADGVVRLSPLTSTSRKASALSFYGAVVVGVGSENPSPFYEAWSWTAAGGFVNLGTGLDSRALALSANGTRMAGDRQETYTGGSSPVGWYQAIVQDLPAGAVTQLPSLSPPIDSLRSFSAAFGLSPDGEYAVGGDSTAHTAFTYDGMDYHDYQAVIWDLASGSATETPLGFLPGAPYLASVAHAASVDATVVVGRAFDSNQYGKACYWHGRSGPPTVLASLSGQPIGLASDVSGDGSVVCGHSEQISAAPENEPEAVLWFNTAQPGDPPSYGPAQSLHALLSARGVNLTGWKLLYCEGISFDGNVVCGNAVDPNGEARGFHAVLDAPPAPLTLTAQAKKKGKRAGQVELQWDGGGVTHVDIYRDGVPIASSVAGGSYTDDLGKQASGTFTYEVCAAGGTATCSNQVTVGF